MNNCDINATQNDDIKKIRLGARQTEIARARV